MPDGPIKGDQQPTVERLLADAWEDFGAPEEGGMAGYKLHGRTEKLRWQRPLISFEIERHGGTARGSTRAEVQGWCVNVDTGEALPTRKGRRQIHPMAKAVRIEPSVDELVRKIQSRGTHPALEWLDDSHIRVTVSRISELEINSTPKATAAGRSRRLRVSLAKRLAELGWDHIADRRWQKRRTGPDAPVAGL